MIIGFPSIRDDPDEVERISKILMAASKAAKEFKYNGYFVEILNYLAWEFEMPGYVKTVREEDDYPDNWITIIFKKR